MFKKIVISTLVVILLGAVVIGAYDIYHGNSSLEMPEFSLAANAAGGGGNGGWSQAQGNGQGRGQRGQGVGQNQSQQGPMTPHTWTTLQGTVASVEAQTMVVDTGEMGQLTLDLGPAGFAEQQGVVFTPGDQVTVQGFDESGMFHAAEITQIASGQNLQLRDPNGRPLWAGQGQGGQGQGNGSGEPQALVNKEWITLNGTVNSQTQQGLVVDTAEMGQLTLQMGPPWFAADQGVVFNPGDTVTVLGFTGEGATFQAGAVTNETTGTTLQLRDPNGRPLWAGRGGQGGGQGQGQGGGKGQGGNF